MGELSCPLPVKWYDSAHLFCMPYLVSLELSIFTLAGCWVSDEGLRVNEWEWQNMQLTWEPLEGHKGPYAMQRWAWGYSMKKKIKLMKSWWFSSEWNTGFLAVYSMLYTLLWKSNQNWFIVLFPNKSMLFKVLYGRKQAFDTRIK